MSEKKVTSDDYGKTLSLDPDVPVTKRALGVLHLQYLPWAVSKEEANGLTDGTYIIKNGEVVRPDCCTATDDILLTTMCAWCRRYKKANGEWSDLSLPDTEDRVSHGICPDCESELDKP